MLEIDWNNVFYFPHNIGYHIYFNIIEWSAIHSFSIKIQKFNDLSAVKNTSSSRTWITFLFKSTNKF